MITCFLILTTTNLESQAKLPWGGTDFVQYYATARLLQQGQNPYDLELSSVIQKQLGRPEGLPTYGPPWCLLPAYLLGYLPFNQAVFVNLGVNTFLLLVCVLGWTNLLFPEKKWLLLLMCVAVPIWLPSVFVITMGQNTLWPLVGFTGWLWFTAKESGVRVQGAAHPSPLTPLLAGASLTLLVVKPHLGLLLGLFAGTYMLRQRLWRSIAAFLFVLGLATLITVVIRPSVWTDYLNALRTGPPPMMFYGATLDGWLRFQGGDSFRYATWAIWAFGLLVGVWLGWNGIGRKGSGVRGQGPAPSPLTSHPSSPLSITGAILCTATLAIVPHAYSYDFVLMIPGFILVLGSFIVSKDRMLFIVLIGWLILDVFYSTGKSRMLQEQNFFVIPWSALGLMLAFLPYVHRPKSDEMKESMS